ncbi:MAG TPA: helix-turn-helix transcriptional regulator [Thermoanaerobaculia bacterium]|nr:helix-turn-helix transcriptional regulator [Thermoanaerobaculia bacterium]
MRSRSQKPTRQKKEQVPAETEAPEGLGNRISHLRRTKGWSQRELAARLGTRSSQISKFERGAYRPRVDMLAHIAELLETSTDFLLTGCEPGEARDARLRARLPLLEALPPEFRELLVAFLDTLLKTHETIRRAGKGGGKGESPDQRS